MPVWPGTPSYGRWRGAGARAPAPGVPSPLAPLHSGRWLHGCHSTRQGAHGSGTCRVGTCVLVASRNPLAASLEARCAWEEGIPAGTALLSRRRQEGVHSCTLAARRWDGVQDQQCGSALHTPASREWPACALGAHSVPRQAGEGKRVAEYQLEEGG